MITIRPVSDLRNHFSEIENCVKENGPVYLTKNGYEADKAAATDAVRYTDEEVFGRVRARIHD